MDTVKAEAEGKGKGTKAWATPLHVLFLHPEGICRKDSSYDISDLSNCAVNMRREPEMKPELEQMGRLGMGFGLTGCFVLLV